jgi:hypothetical protein
MANELTVSATLALTNGKLKERAETGALQVTQSVALSFSPTVIVGTSEEDLAIGDIATLGWVLLQNLDSANYVQWGPKSAGAMVAIGRLKAGEFALLRLEPGITLRWVANTAAVNVKITLINN